MKLLYKKYFSKNEKKGEYQIGVYFKNKDLKQSKICFRSLFLCYYYFNQMIRQSHHLLT